MNDLNDLALFVAVVKHGGFSAASRATGIEKTKLSRRVAELENKLNTTLLNRTTRMVTTTEAGEHFYQQCEVVVNGAKVAFESINHLKSEPTGIVRVSCPTIMAQLYLQPIIPSFLKEFPKVNLLLLSTDRPVNLFEEGLDIVIRGRPQIEDSADLVARELVTVRRILVASPEYLEEKGVPRDLEELKSLDIISSLQSIQAKEVKLKLKHISGADGEILVTPKLISSDFEIHKESAIGNVGVALVPEAIASKSIDEGKLVHILQDWYASPHIVHMLYPKPKGLLPAVRSFIDYVIENAPKHISKY